jgi:ribosomal protein L11 methylase PrmA
MPALSAARAGTAAAIASSVKAHTASFRDPSGFVFVRDGVLYRQVQTVYREHYDHLASSGLLGSLVRDGHLVAHEECQAAPAAPGAYKVLRPALVDVISYPFEWSFGQLKDAALLTLRVQARALEAGMTLKDASAYNVQYQNGRPIFIDTLSFERHVAGQAWQGYRQFCQHFLAPLALMSRIDIRLGQLTRVHLDGVPLDLASRLLPRHTWFRPGLAMHLHWHARSQRRYADQTTGGPERAVSAGRVTSLGMRGILQSLERVIEGLTWDPTGTEWADYESTHRYGEAAHAHKRELVRDWFTMIGPTPRRVIDLGANAGVFSRLVAEKGATVMAVDGDAAAVERNYRRTVADATTGLLPLLADLTNLEAGAGWAGEERLPLFSRTRADLALCLALVHHLAIGNNVPLDRLAGWLRTIAPQLIIEFVPKSDPQVQRLLVSRTDVFSGYTEEAFEAMFERHFVVRRRQPIAGCERTLYHMEVRSR